MRRPWISRGRIIRMMEIRFWRFSSKYSPLMRAFPELEMLTSPKARSDEFKAAYRAAGGYALTIGMASLNVLAWVVLSEFLLPAWLSRGWWRVLPASLLAIMLAWCSWRIARGRVQLCLRKRLRELGYPICIPCGYNLTGNTSGVCPECGTGIEGEN